MIHIPIQFFGGNGSKGSSKKGVAGAGGAGGAAVAAAQPVANTDALGFKDYDAADYHQL